MERNLKNREYIKKKVKLIKKEKSMKSKRRCRIVNEKDFLLKKRVFLIP